MYLQPPWIQWDPHFLSKVDWLIAPGVGPWTKLGQSGAWLLKLWIWSRERKGREKYLVERLTDSVISYLSILETCRAVEQMGFPAEMPRKLVCIQRKNNEWYTQSQESIESSDHLTVPGPRSSLGFGYILPGGSEWHSLTPGLNPSFAQVSLSGALTCNQNALPIF